MSNIVQKKYLLITASVIEGIDLWSNGLHQNGLFLYNLFEAAGYLPMFLLSKNPNSEESQKYRIVEFGNIQNMSIQVYAFIIMGANCDNTTRDLFKNKGAKIFTLFLGNILTTDIEKPICTDIYFAHHSYGSHETVLLSPHHYYNQDYASALFNVYPNAKIAPYVWDSVLIKDLMDTYKWSSKGPYSFTIMEPNFSFLKCSFLPIMICEAFYRENPGVLDGVVVVNGSKIAQSRYFLTNVLSKLDLHRDKRLFLIGRMTIREAVSTFKQNILICNGVNNDYNYLFLEHLFMGFPVIHNYEMLKDYGYYYKGNDIETGKNMIQHVIETHGSNLEKYKAACKQLFWKFSIYNPENIKGWQNILDA